MTENTLEIAPKLDAKVSQDLLITAKEKDRLQNLQEMSRVQGHASPFGHGDVLEGQITSKPESYLDIGGVEQELPSVKNIEASIKNGETFIVVGGGGSGKTESLITALEQQNKSYEFFNLRDWTIQQLSESNVRKECLADSDLDQRARDYLTQLNEMLDEPDNSGIATDEVAKILKRQYLTDSTYGIKYAEAYLLDSQIGRAHEGAELSDGYEKNSASSITNGTNEVLILDEFDLGIGRELADVEIETAGKLIKLAISKQGRQLGVVVHPPARNDDRFVETINSVFAEHGGASEMVMEYFPENVETAVLASVGLDGEIADGLKQDMQGLPSAYLDICTDAGLREQLLGMSPKDRAFAFEGLVEKKIAKNKKIIFDRLTPKTQQYLIGFLNGLGDVSADPKVIQEALINLYISEKNGNIYMPPVIERVLGEELGINKLNNNHEKYPINLETLEHAAYLGIEVRADFQSLIGHLNEYLERQFVPRKSGFHLSIFTPPEMNQLRQMPSDRLSELASDLKKLREQSLEELIDVDGIGFLDGNNFEGIKDEDKDKKAVFLAINAPAIQALREKYDLGTKDLHVTLGIENGDIYETVSRDDHGDFIAKSVSKKASPQLEQFKPFIPKEIDFSDIFCPTLEGR